MNVFNELPNAQKIDLLTKWLTYADIACLDSATCSTNLRKELHHVLSSPDCYFNSPLTINDQDAAAWIIERQIKLRVESLTYNFMKNCSDRTLLLECTGSSIKSLKLLPGWIYDSSDSDENGEDDQVPFDIICYDICRTCTNLSELSLSSAKLDGVLSLFIHNNKNLQKLHFSSSTNVTSSILAACSSSTSLQVLSLVACTYSSAVPFVCSGTSFCAELRITSVLFDDAQLCNMCQCFPIVQHLELKLISGDSLALIATHCCNVRRGIFHLQTAPTSADMYKIATTWENIVVLQIRCAVEFLPNTTLPIIMHCPRLQHLRLDSSTDSWPFCYYQVKDLAASKDSSDLSELHVPMLSETELHQIARCCKQAHTLAIYHTAPTQLVAGCAEFALQHIALSSITHLTLKNITNLTESHLLPVCNLLLFRLHNVGVLSDHAITTVVAKSPLLRALYIENCEGITPDILLPIIKSCHTLRSVRYQARGFNIGQYNPPPAVKILLQVVKESYPHLKYFYVSF